MAASQTSVLVVGGGPVGLTLSALLSRYGVDHMLVETRRTTSSHPKARGISARSMEIFRRIGLEEQVRGAGLPAEQVYFYRGRDLVDPEFVRTGLARQPDNDDSGEHTPSPGLICSQDVLEPVLLRHAVELAGPRVRFGTRLVSFTDDGQGVLAVVEDTAIGSRRQVRADWLVGCDGATSTLRNEAGIAMEGPTGLGRYLSIRYEAPLGQVVADRASASYFLTTPGRGGFMAVDNDRHWIYQYPLTPDAPELDPSDHGHLAGLIRTATGIPDLDVTVRDTMTWRMDAQLANAYRRSRVLLAGDAAHTIPPTGGHGMNTGIGDADNLAWKLAAVTTGYAGDALLDSYEAERRPIARQVIGISTANAQSRAGYRIDDELLLTATYQSTAVIPDPDSAPKQTGLSPDGYRPGCHPGQRAPHVRLTGGDVGATSTLDLVGPGFTLLTATDNPAWRRRAETVQQTGIPLVFQAVSTVGSREATGLWERLVGTGGAPGAVLVRPDGHVAWRGTDPEVDLQAVLQRILTS
ncbi:FAD-dependent monooxygenase [Kitasatospora sp. NPDC127059]